MGMSNVIGGTATRTVPDFGSDVVQGMPVVADGEETHLNQTFRGEPVGSEYHPTPPPRE